MNKDTAFKSTLVGLAAASLLTAATVASAAGKLNISNWAEYMAEDTIPNFAKEFDVEVTFTPYDSVEAIDAKLLAGSSGYDVVIHAASQAARLIPGGILRKIDKTKLPNFKHMSADVMAQLGNKWDPGHNYMVPFMWGTHGVTINEALVLETYPDAPIGSIEIEMLLKVRPYIKTFDNYAYQRMPEKEFCVSVTWGPDGLLAMSGAEEAGTGVELDFFLPSAPAAPNFWVDSWVIPADAKNVENAHLFMNYLMRPEVSAADSNYSWYATANKDAFPLIDEEVTGSPAAFPTAAQISTMYTLAPLPPKMERVRTRTWTNFKAGN